MNITEILKKHKNWFLGLEGGERANLEGASLRNADLIGANLERAFLGGAVLRGAGLRHANLEGANLEGASLRNADLIGANLEGVNLIDADLSGADLRYANLSEVDLSGATLDECNGLRWASISFFGFGENDRKLTVARINSEEVYFCGCFRGSINELEEYINKGDEHLKESRSFGLKLLNEAYIFSSRKKKS